MINCKMLHIYKEKKNITIFILFKPNRLSENIPTENFYQSTFKFCRIFFLVYYIFKERVYL